FERIVAEAGIGAVAALAGDGNGLHHHALVHAPRAQIGGLADHGEARLWPPLCSQLAGAIHRRLLVGGGENDQRLLQRLVKESPGGFDRDGEEAFHVGGAQTVPAVVALGQVKRVAAPLLGVVRHRVGVAGKYRPARSAAGGGDQVRLVRLRHQRTDLHLEAQCLQPLREQLDHPHIGHVQARRAAAYRRRGDQRLEHAEHIGNRRSHRVIRQWGVACIKSPLARFSKGVRAQRQRRSVLSGPPLHARHWLDRARATIIVRYFHSLDIQMVQLSALPAERALDSRWLLEELLREGRVSSDEAERILRMPRFGDEAKMHPTEWIAAQKPLDLGTPGKSFTAESLLGWLGARVQQPYFHIDPLKINVTAVTDVMSFQFAQRHRILAVEVTPERVTIASAEPFIAQWQLNLEHALRRPIRRVLAKSSDLDRYTVEFYALARSVRKASTGATKISAVTN